MTISNDYIASIVDELGDLRTRMAALKAREEEIRADLEMHLKVSKASAAGLAWVVTRSDVTATVLDQAKVKAELGARLPEFQKAQTSIRFSVKLLAATSLAA